jgi:hypothetical protein
MQAFGSMSDRGKNMEWLIVRYQYRKAPEKKFMIITPSVIVELCANSQRAATQTRLLHETYFN